MFHAAVKGSLILTFQKVAVVYSFFLKVEVDLHAARTPRRLPVSCVCCLYTDRLSVLLHADL